MATEGDAFLAEGLSLATSAIVAVRGVCGSGKGILASN
jgi:hypothetical protein